MLHAITAARTPLVRRKVARKVEKHPRLRMLARFRKLVCGLPLIRSRKAHRGRKMTMKRVFRILMKTYGLADPTHNERAAWKFPTTKTTSAEILRLAKSLTYGELHPNSWYRALRCLKLRKEDVVVDLGSGTGKIIVQAALQSTCKKLIGIEILHNRHEEAMCAHAKLERSMPRTSARINFIEGNFLEANISEATVVYMANHVFEEPLPTNILEKLKTLPSLRAVVCMTEPCFKHTDVCHKLDKACASFYSKFKLESKGRCDVSWSHGSALLVYKLRA